MISGGGGYWGSTLSANLYPNLYLYQFGRITDMSLSGYDGSHIRFARPDPPRVTAPALLKCAYCGNKYHPDTYRNRALTCLTCGGSIDGKP